MATSTIRVHNPADITNNLTATSEVSTSYNPVLSAIRYGKMVSLSIIFHPASASLQNKAFYTMGSLYAPKADTSLSGTCTLVYNAQSKTLAFPVTIAASGIIKTANNGAYGELLTLTDLAEIRISGTYIMN